LSARLTGSITSDQDAVLVSADATELRLPASLPGWAIHDVAVALAGLQQVGFVDLQHPLKPLSLQTLHSIQNLMSPSERGRQGNFKPVADFAKRHTLNHALDKIEPLVRLMCSGQRRSGGVVERLVAGATTVALAITIKTVSMDLLAATVWAGKPLVTPILLQASSNSTGRHRIGEQEIAKGVIEMLAVSDVELHDRREDLAVTRWFAGLLCCGHLTLRAVIGSGSIAEFASSSNSHNFR
jgi:hypothetical protein